MTFDVTDSFKQLFQDLPQTIQTRTRAKLAIWRRALNIPACTSRKYAGHIGHYACRTITDYSVSATVAT